MGYPVTFECRNCSNIWGENIEAGHELIETRFGCKVVKKKSMLSFPRFRRRIICPNCKMDHKVVKQRLEEQE